MRGSVPLRRSRTSRLYPDGSITESSPKTKNEPRAVGAGFVGCDLVCVLFSKPAYDDPAPTRAHEVAVVVVVVVVIAKAAGVIV
jgi:hypothetical protein